MISILTLRTIVGEKIRPCAHAGVSALCCGRIPPGLAAYPSIETLMCPFRVARFEKFQSELGCLDRLACGRAECENSHAIATTGRSCEILPHWCADMARKEPMIRL